MNNYYLLKRDLKWQNGKQDLVLQTEAKLPQIAIPKLFSKSKHDSEGR